MPKNIQIEESTFKGMRDKVCNSKKELHNWIKYYLGIDFPDTIVDLDSNCSPMDMIWKCYHTMIHSEHTNPKEYLFIANRVGFKTLGMSVIELLMLVHAKIDVCHIGAIEAQAKRCYNYFLKYFKKGGIFRDLLVKDPVMEKTTLKSGESLEILPCTLAAVNGPHTPFVGMDEVDTVINIMAYDDIEGIATNTRDGRPHLKVETSTRKTAYGLVATKAENAHETGTEVFSWNKIDLTERCPDSRSLSKKIDIYANLDTLEAISEKEWRVKAASEKSHFEKMPGLEGCLKNCKMFAACRGALKNQTCKSNLLHTVDYTQHYIFSKSVDWANAQALCRKPSTEGVIYPRFGYKDHVKTYYEMWEIYTGEAPENEVDLTTLYGRMKKDGCYFDTAADYGDDMAVVQLMAVDGKGRVYTLFEETFNMTDDHELSLWAKENLLKYDPEFHFGDPASPSANRLFRKAGFVTGEVDKDVWAGINTVRSFLRIPGTNRPKWFIWKGCSNLIWEIPRYHRKKQKSTNMLMQDPEKKNDHSCDTSRYHLHSRFGKAQPNLGFATSSKKDDEVPLDTKKAHRAPDALEFAEHVGLVGFADNDGEFIEDKKTGKFRRRKPNEYDDGEDGSGDFSF